MGLVRKRGGTGKTAIGKVIKGAAKIVSAPVRAVKQVAGNRGANQSQKANRRKSIEEMSDAEFDDFAKDFDNEKYWSLQERRGVYPPEFSDNEDYENDFE